MKLSRLNIFEIFEPSHDHTFYTVNGGQVIRANSYSDWINGTIDGVDFNMMDQNYLS